MKKFMPRSFKDRYRDQFVQLTQGQIIVIHYDTRFQELSQYATSILPTEEERIHDFMQRLRPQLRMGTLVLVTSSRSYLDIIDQTHSLELFSCETQRSNNKQTMRDGEFSGSRSAFRVPNDRPLRRVSRIRLVNYSRHHYSLSRAQVLPVEWFLLSYQAQIEGDQHCFIGASWVIIYEQSSFSSCQIKAV